MMLACVKWSADCICLARVNECTDHSAVSLKGGVLYSGVVSFAMK